jgi:hypothetical protein
MTHSLLTGINQYGISIEIGNDCGLLFEKSKLEQRVMNAIPS